MKTALALAGLMCISALPVIADEPSSAATPTVAAPASSSDQDRFGAGLIIGEPTGISLKYFITEAFAIDGALGWSFRDETDPHVHADALWHFHDLLDTREGQFSLYLGVGARVKFRDHAEDRVGVRIPLGVCYKFDRAPIDLFVEAAPIIDFTPSTDGSFSAGLGVRYWF